MRYLVIGLGIYGSNLAIDLTQMGHEVIGADRSASNVDAVKDYISAAYIADTTDETAVNALPLKNVDLVIVAIGENFGASVKTVALLKKVGVKRIYARAIDELHESILAGLEVERILTPEQRAAKDLVHEMELGTHVEALGVDKDHYVLKFEVPQYFYGLRYADLKEGDRLFGLSLVAVTRRVRRINVLGLGNDSSAVLDLSSGSEVVEQGDVLICFGAAASYRKMFRIIAS